jgi:hypothetical protein
LDTRKKIISLPDAKALLEDGAWAVIVGLFDPLTAFQARRIDASGDAKTLIVVLQNPDALLPAEARCHLLAALRSVDFVVQATEHEWRSTALHNKNIRVIEDLEGERRRSQNFVELIASHQNS